MEFLPIFQFLASNKYFVDHYWQKQPLLVNSKLQSLQQSLEMKDIEKITHSEFIDATKGIHSSSSGWKMHPVSKPRGNSYEDAKLRFEDIVSSMQDKNGTVVINSAGTIIPEMAKVCLEAIQAFKLPVAINIYMTNAGKEVSAPLHTDKQNVFVLQTQGQKHWRVFQPPHPAERCRADAFARGKGNDMFNFNELSEPLVDTVLSPGQMLYIPAGFPHTTGKYALQIILVNVL